MAAGRRTAALASAVEPAALISVPGLPGRVGAPPHDLRVARSSGAAEPGALLLAPSGLGVFALFLWVRTGTPFASYQAQHSGWHQGDPFALLNQPVAHRLLAHPATLWSHLLNPSLWNGLLGTVFLVCALVALARVRHELTPGVMLWTCGVGVLTLWSVMSLTNARMLLIAFPAVIVWARALTGRRYQLFLGAEAALFLLATGLTLGGHMLP